jgi:hypothetical protein
MVGRAKKDIYEWRNIWSITRIQTRITKWR